MGRVHSQSLSLQHGQRTGIVLGHPDCFPDVDLRDDVNLYLSKGRISTMPRAVAPRMWCFTDVFIITAIKQQAMLNNFMIARPLSNTETQPISVSSCQPLNPFPQLFCSISPVLRSQSQESSGGVCIHTALSSMTWLCLFPPAVWKVIWELLRWLCAVQGSHPTKLNS